MLTNMKLRNHTHICTGCEQSFGTFKQLRKHWNGNCPLCQPEPPLESPSSSITLLPETSSTPLLPDRQPINPASSMWLNNDDIQMNDTDYDNVTINSIRTATDETINESTESSKPFNDSNKQTQDTNELIMLLLEAVEKLSEIVLGTSHAVSSTPVPITPLEPPNDWRTVKRNSRVSKEKEHKTSINLSNRFQVFENIPDDTIRTSTPTQEPVNTWATSPAVQPKAHLRRPTIVINKCPERDIGWKKSVPGNSTFSDIVEHGKRVVLFSDSICNRFSEWQMNKKANNCRIKKKSFPGATALDLAEHHVHPYLRKNCPDTAIIHAGANDILQLGGEDVGLTDKLIDSICSNILTCGMVCKEYGINQVCISSILSGKSSKFRLSANFVNIKLELLCKQVGFHFIRNNNIVYEKPTHLYKGLFYKDGLHLNDDGRAILMMNFIDYLDGKYSLSDHD